MTIVSTNRVARKRSCVGGESKRNRAMPKINPAVAFLFTGFTNEKERKWRDRLFTLFTRT